MMCTVQVLLVTDIVGRPGDLVRPNPPPRSICRRLFADDLSAALPSPSEFLGRLRDDMEKKDKERWNFDFRTETPLPGRYQWVPVRPRAESVRTLNDSVIVTEVQQNSKDKTEDMPSPSLRQSSNISKTTTQSKITDFLLQRKRHRVVSSDLDSPKLKSRRIYTERSTDFFSCRSSAT